MSRATSIVFAEALREGCGNAKDVDMVTVDCPMCLGPVALNDEDVELICEDCAIHVEIAAGERSEIVARAA